MKGNKILHILLSLALIFTMCAPVAVKAETTFRVIAPNGPSTTEAAFGYEGGSYDLVVITSDNSVWTAYPSASWITTSKKTGQASNPTVTISVAKSYSNTERTGSVIFKTAQSSYTFTINQARSPIINTNPNVPEYSDDAFRVLAPNEPSVEKAAFGYNGGTYDLVVIPKTNSDWTAYPSASWIMTSKKTGKASDPSVTISAAKNNTVKERTGAVSFKTDKGIYTLNITQSGNPNGVDPDKEPTDLYVEKTSLQAGATGQSFFVVAGSNRAWTATPDASWIYFIDPHTDHGAAGSTVIMYIGTRANTTGKTRVGHINVKAGDVTKTITITQNAQ